MDMDLTEIIIVGVALLYGILVIILAILRRNPKFKEWFNKVDPPLDFSQIKSDEPMEEIKETEESNWLNKDLDYRNLPNIVTDPRFANISGNIWHDSFYPKK